MATVVNLDGTTGVIDPPLTKHNVTNAGNPNGVVTPNFSGEILLDTTNDLYWKAMGSTNSEWVAITKQVV